MALAFNAIIPHTGVLSSSSSVGFGSSSQKPSHSHFSTLVSHPRSRRVRNRISHGASAFAGKISAIISDVEQHQLQGNDTGSSPASTSTTAWSEFSRNVSGEWDGYGADFSNEGNPVELPESVVPEAYREWEVKVFDWQTQCPTLANPKEHLLSYKLIKLLPTVGCEADAATQYSIDERNVGGLNNKVSAFAYQSSGCYVSVWLIENNDQYNLLELEHCLIHPQDRESRVRVIQKWGAARWMCNRNSAFASTAALKASEVVGIWQVQKAFTNFDVSQTNFLQELVDGSTQKSVRDELDLVLLPKQLWCSLKEGKDGDTCGEVGWLLNHGRAITSKCTFSSTATLKASL
ncbi:hypothetical protein FNV43_RR21977 [Rhamnella rubrinervis]|uniref:Uncharacterized protein n=1 Tax=Rhamnella rubrinervis TaxID=2594499 RepID=A0A8K0GUQ9_9ROSA|nr:hypothetical protein FNV43_RR21977 [Rhamnella rubrinervis]